MIGVSLSSFALADALWPEAGVNEIFPDLKLSVLVPIETVSIPDSGKFHVEFSDCVSHQYELALCQGLWVRGRRLEVGVQIQVNYRHLLHGLRLRAHFID